MIAYITDCCGGEGEGAEGISDQEAADQESNQEGGEGLAVAEHCCLSALITTYLQEVLLLTNSPNTRSRTPNKEDVGITVVAEVCPVLFSNWFILS